MWHSLRNARQGGLTRDDMEQHFSVPHDAAAALYFLPGQYLFKLFDDANESAKALSSEQVALAFRDFRTDTGWLDRRILRYRESPDGNAFLSYEPARIRSIFVERDNGKVEKLTLPLPTLILLGKGKDYFLWAATGRGVTAKTKLAVAPFPNVSAGIQGKICFGHNEVPECRADNLDAVWNLIFNAPFNRDQANGKCQSEPADVRKLLFQLSHEKPKKFSTSELLVSNATVGEAWDTFVEQRRYDSRF